MENDGATVLLGVAGSVAAFRTIDLASRLTQSGYRVDVVLTAAAHHFVRPLSFEAVTHRPAYTDESPGMLGGRAIHIELADRARVVLVAPATADLIGRYACGLAPDLLSALLLATTAPVVLAPAMNTQMWMHAAVRDNVALLQGRGVRLVGPESGLLSCGAEGPGRLWPVDRLFAAVEELWPSSASAGIAPEPAGKELVIHEREAISLSGQEAKEVNEMTEKKKAAKKPAAKKVAKNSKKGPAAKKR